VSRYKDFVNNLKIVYDEKSDEHFLNISSEFFEADTSKCSKEEKDQIWMCHMLSLKWETSANF